MAQKLQFILFLGVCLWANDVSSSTFKFNSLTRQLLWDTNECIKSGLVCDDCMTVSECIEVFPGYFIKEALYTCDGGSCLKSMGNCTTLPNPECDKNIINYNLTCRQVGLFPHPFNQCKYFMCLPSENGSTIAIPKKITCSPGFGYDAYTGLCRTKLADSTCPMLLPPCSIAGQRGGVPGHSAMYYICLRETSTAAPMPQLFVCPENQVYNNAKRTCENPIVPSCPA